MSRSNMQALVLLSTFAGCLGTLMSRNCFARVDIRERINSTFDQVCLTINQWPFDNTDKLKPALEKIHAWADILGVKQENIPAGALVYIMSRILSDLEDRIRNRWKREQLTKLRGLFQPIEDFVDAERASFGYYDEGEKLMRYLDKLLEA